MSPWLPYAPSNRREVYRDQTLDCAGKPLSLDNHKVVGPRTGGANGLHALCDCERADGVISKPTVRMEELEIKRRTGMPFKPGSDDIACHSSKHC